MNRTVIIICRGDHTFADELHQIIRALHDHDSGPEGEISNCELSRQLSHVINKLDTIIDKENSIMATLAEVQTELADLKATTDSEHQQAQVVLDKVTALEAQVADLQAQLAAGNVATAADLDGLLTQIRDIKTGVNNIVP